MNDEQKYVFWAVIETIIVWGVIPTLGIFGLLALVA